MDEIEAMGKDEPLSKEKTMKLLDMMKEIKKSNESHKYDKIILKRDLNALTHKTAVIQTFVDKATSQ